MLHGLANGSGSLGVYRFLLGMGEAGNWPGGVKVVAEWFPVSERALASGIFNSGSSVGAILAPPVVVWIVLRFGWRAAFVFLGATGLIWVAIWLLVYYTPPHSEQEEEAPEDFHLAALLHAVRLELHARQGFSGSRLVLLYFLVSGIFEACPSL